MWIFGNENSSDDARVYIFAVRARDIICRGRMQSIIGFGQLAGDNFRVFPVIAACWLAAGYYIRGILYTGR